MRFKRLMQLLYILFLANNRKEFTLDLVFFERRLDWKEFQVVSRVRNSAPTGSQTGNKTIYILIQIIYSLTRIGESRYIMKINQKPEGGQCTIDKNVGKAMVDTFTLECFEWTDPEEKGIKHYAIRSKKNITNLLFC